MAVLDRAEVERRLAALPGWEWAEGAIRRRYRFPDFVAAMGFVQQVALLAEKADHHPDLLVRYGEVTLTLATHSEGGVTEKDLELAARIERLGAAGTVA
ncbi:MAG: 4a-hydroxytetrahydrobiopterin dehydratase [Firmicutes bacterium]|jgi:4a-hydroxytetrahydrobiopterin dehydratase|nr:4a-hydroxytetrahydrobiopterin dehydratase [Bacillota bacterium]